MRPTWQSLTERNGIPERSLEKQREAVCVLHARHHLVLLVSCSRISLWDSMPQTLRLPRPPCGLAMTRNRSVLFGKQIFLVVFSCFRLELTSAFPAKPTDSVIARSAATRQSLSRRHGIPWRSTGSENRQNPEFLIRPAGTPHRRSVGSAISRGRKPAFHMRQHISHDQRSYFTAQPYSANGRISLRSLAAASRSIFPLRPLPLRAILTVRLSEIFCLLSDILAFPVPL